MNFQKKLLKMQDKHSFDKSNLFLLIFLGVIFGTYLVRLNPYLFHYPLWLDEINWMERANNISERIISIRAPLYIFSNFIINKIFHSDFAEYKIRLLSIIPGLLWPILYYKLMSKIFTSKAIILSATLLACSNAVIVSYTHEAKPYMLALFLHTLWFFLILNPTKRHYSISTFVLFVSVFFDYSIFILYPVHFLIGLWHIKNNLISKKYLFWSTMALFTVGLGFCLVYFNLLHVREGHWGRKYEIFYMGETESFFEWFFERTSTLISFCLNLYHEGHYIKNFWLGLISFLLLCLALRKKTKEPAFIISLSIFTIYTVLGLFHKWPYGYFRTNIFMYVYFSILIMYSTPLNIRNHIYVTLAAISVFTSIKQDFWLKTPGTSSNIKNNLIHICSNISEKDSLIVDKITRKSFYFYLEKFRDKGIIQQNNKCNEILENHSIENVFMNYGQLDSIISNTINMLDENDKIWLITRRTSQMRNLDQVKSSLEMSYNIDMIHYNNEIFATISK